MKAPIGRWLRKTKLFLRSDIDLRFLPHIRGVIHVGANVGQERALYDDYRLAVLWIEPLPDVFDKLVANTAPYARQRALRYLVAEQDGVVYPFHRASNEGASSSIFEATLHREVWPEVTFSSTTPFESVTLPSLLERETVDVAEYDALVIDTQGSELLVLRGAERLLRNFRYIKLEASDLELYAGCPLLRELDSYVAGFGFQEIARRQFAEHGPGGAYDVLYERDA